MGFNTTYTKSLYSKNLSHNADDTKCQQKNSADKRGHS